MWTGVLVPLLVLQKPMLNSEPADAATCVIAASLKEHWRSMINRVRASLLFQCIAGFTLRHSLNPMCMQIWNDPSLLAEVKNADSIDRAVLARIFLSLVQTEEFEDQDFEK